MKLEREKEKAYNEFHFTFLDLPMTGDPNGHTQLMTFKKAQDEGQASQIPEDCGLCLKSTTLGKPSVANILKELVTLSRQGVNYKPFA